VTTSSDRRSFIRASTGFGALAALGIPGHVMAQAATSGQLTIAFPTDVPTWDPNARALGAVQSLYKMVFDQPLDQAPGLGQTQSHRQVGLRR
jgi:peptide/nickel transport system substrate-binding protein